MKRRTKIVSYSILWAIGMLLFISTAGADIIYVDAGAPAGGDGTSWARAFRDIQTAVNHASPVWMQCTAPEDQIWIKKGLYRIRREIVIDRVVTIYGGFNGTEADPSERDYWSNQSIVDGVNMTRCFHIFSYCVVDGLIIRRGAAQFGGGIYIDSRPVQCDRNTLTTTIRNCRITYNKATTGAGVYDFESDAVFDNCRLDNNIADSEGGGIFLDGSSAEIIETAFKSNEANLGGGMAGWEASPQVIGCLFRGNTAIDCGGGMNNSGGYPYVLNSIFLENTAKSDSTYTFTGGGGINNAYAHPKIINCIFSENTAGKYGGGVLNYVSFEESAITSCTFNKNAAGISGGGLATGFSEIFELSVTNSIFWENSAEPIYTMAGLPPVVTYCDVQGGYGVAGDHNIDKNPRLVSPATGDFHLNAKSPCIDAGDNYAPYLYRRDFEGDRRRIDDPYTTDTGNGKRPITDMGADEYSPDTIIKSTSLTIKPTVLKKSGINQRRSPIKMGLFSMTEDRPFLFIPIGVAFPLWHGCVPRRADAEKKKAQAAFVAAAGLASPVALTDAKH